MPCNRWQFLARGRLDLWFTKVYNWVWSWMPFMMRASREQESQGVKNRKSSGALVPKRAESLVDLPMS